MTLDELFAASVEHHQAGRLAEAEAGYRQILTAEPRHADSLHLLGVVAHQVGRSDAAVELIGDAIRLQPGIAAFHLNRGEALRVLGRAEEAVIEARHVLSLVPDYVDAHHNLGLALWQSGRGEDALDSIRRALALSPDYANAHNSLGAVLRSLGRFEEAIQSFHRAVTAGKDVAEYWNSLGGALQEQGVLAEAEDCLNRALLLNPHHAGARNNLGEVLRRQGKLEAAEAAFRQAIASDPRCVEAFANLGLVAQAYDDLDGAIDCFGKALAIDPRHGAANANLSSVLWRRGRLGEAISAAELAIVARIVPPEAPVQLGHLRGHACDWREVEADERRMRAAARGFGGPVGPWPLFLIESEPNLQFETAQRYARTFMAKGETLEEAPPPPRNRRIRLGYLSADFRAHATSHLLADLIESHDRSRFEVVGYSLGVDDGSPARRRMEAGFDRFVDMRLFDHQAAAQRIRDDGIDILVDLMGYTNLARPSILGRRPAPIQVSYLAYAGTMAADFMDYMIADPVVLPKELEPFFSEAIVRLPFSYQPNDRKREIATEVPSRAECGLPEGGFVFCCFNSPVKLRPRIFDRWMNILKAVPGSVLWLLAKDDLVCANLRREAEARGVDPQRLVFARSISAAEHLARHAQADLFLDTLPYNAHTTASDALWAGVPVLTCKGETFPSRVAASLLEAAGLPELVMPSLDAYEAEAIRLATEPGAIAGLKGKLAATRDTMPLFDTERYARDIEAAFERMVERVRAGLTPEGFSIPPN